MHILLAAAEIRTHGLQNYEFRANLCYRGHDVLQKIQLKYCIINCIAKLKKPGARKRKDLAKQHGVKIMHNITGHDVQVAERRHFQLKKNYQPFSENLLSKLEISEVEKKFSPCSKDFFEHVFLLKLHKYVLIRP